LLDSRDNDVAEATVAQQALELPWVRKGMFASFDPRSFWPQHLIECLHKCVRAWRPFDGAVHAECSPSALAHHTVQLAQCSGLVREELETLLTEHNVEMAGRKWHVDRTTLRLVNRGAIVWKTSGNSQHPGVQVETRDLSRPYFRCGQASHDPGAASNIQY
jgi:hypothetical protein